MTKKLQQCNTNKSSKFIPLFKQGQPLRKRKESRLYAQFNGRTLLFHSTLTVPRKKVGRVTVFATEKPRKSDAICNQP